MPATAADPVPDPFPDAGRSTPAVLRVYLGAAPGVGKTVAMLSEGHRRRSRGVDVVVGLVETHGRAYTADQLGDLPVVPRRSVEYRGMTLLELDVDAVIARKPQVVLVDEMAHTNAPGSPRAKRWEDIQVLLDAGITVITTVNIQHLESLTDAVQAITGIVQAETVPDAVVRAADQIELVDMSPQALRRRLAHGHVYPPDRVDAAMTHYFREGNLGALRELALLWVADRVDEALATYRAQHGITGTWPARERVVVALPPGPEGEQLLRRGAQIAGRVHGRDLMAVLVVPADGSAGPGTHAHLVEKHRTLTENLGGTFHVVVGDDPAAAVLDFARDVNGTQVVVGVSGHTRLTQLFRPSTSMAIVRDSGDIDVHIVTHKYARAARRLRVPGGRSRWSWIAAPVVPLLLTGALLPWRGHLDLSSVLLIYLLGVLGNAVIGGVLPAMASALAAGLMANFFFVDPVGTLTVSSAANLLALVVFVLVGASVAGLVDRSTARARDAERGRSQAQLFAAIAGGVEGGPSTVADVLERARVGFGMTSVALLQRAPHDRWTVLASAGSDIATEPEDADVLAEVDQDRLLALRGRTLSSGDRRVLEVVAGQAVTAVEREWLREEAARSETLARAESLRTAILTALSHDLRTPLATITAAVSSLRDPVVQWSDADRADLLRSADTAAAQLGGLLENLLDMSRLQSGTVHPVRRVVSVDEVLHRALIGIEPRLIRDDIADDLPLLDTDAGLLERVFANLIGNAVRHAPDGSPVRLLGGVAPDGAVEIRIADRGPGVGDAGKVRMFEPFQQLGDVPGGGGLGLGLAVARGFAEAVDASLEAEDTPGGGLTMVVRIPAAQAGVSA